MEKLVEGDELKRKIPESKQKLFHLFSFVNTAFKSEAFRFLFSFRGYFRLGFLRRA